MFRSSMEESIYNSFNNLKKSKLMKYCMKMRDVDDFRCGRSNRQKYIHFPQPEDYCLEIGKIVYVQFPDVIDILPATHILRNSGIFNRITKSDTSNVSQLPVQNLLGENYNQESYTVFLKAMLKTDTNKSKFKLLFDLSNFSGNMTSNKC